MVTSTDQIRGWLAELGEIEREGDAVLKGLTNAQGDWRPAPGKWSIAECVSHLRLVGTLLLERLEPLLIRARDENQLSGEPARLGRIGGWFTRTMERTGRRTMPSPRNFRPPSGIPLDSAAAAWRIYHVRLRRAIESAEGLALRKVRMTSVAEGAGFLRLNAAAWLASTLAHERRHIAQMRRVRDAEGFPR